MPSAARMRRSTGSPKIRSRHLFWALCPIKICVMRFSRANRYRIVAFEHFGRRTGLFGRIEILTNRDSVSFGATGLAHVHRVEFTLKTFFVALPAFNHCRSIGMRRHANEEAFVCPKHRLNSVRMNIGLQLRVYHFGSQQQGEFAKFRELAFLGVADSLCSELFSLPPEAEVRGHIHGHDVIGGEQEGLRNSLGGVLAGDRVNFFLVLLDMKQVNARQDGDPIAQKLLNILPTISVPACGWVLSGERINDADLRRAAENGIEIDGLTLGSLQWWNRLQFPQDCLNF